MKFHPQLAPQLARIAESGPDPEVFQKLAAPLGPPEEWDLKIEDRHIDGSLRVRVYRPAADAGDRPCLVWLHGGGWVEGDIDMPEAHETARGVAGRADAVVVSVDYRLCDENVHFPAPHDDVVSAYRWVRRNAPSLGVDPARIAIGGASAGGNLAAGAALRLSDEGEPPRQALLLYPVLHAPVPEPSGELAEAVAMIPAGLSLTNELMARVFTIFLGGAQVETAPAYAFPGHAGDLRGFPPTYLENDEFDTLRASGERFADQLRAAGVEVEQVTSRGVVHGHLNIIGLQAAHATLDRMAARLVNT